MITEETYILTKHSNFDSEYVENIPIYKRRYFLDLLEKENEMIKKENDKMLRQYR
jgi:hypothetical protein